MLEALHVGVIAFSADLDVVRANAAAGALFGYPDSLVGKRLSDLIPSRLHAAHDSHVSAFRSSPGEHPAMHHRRDVVGRHFDGHDVPIEASVRRLGGDNDGLFVAVLTDASEQRAFEAAQARQYSDGIEAARRELDSSEQRFEALIASSAEPIMVFDRGRRLRFLNDAAREGLADPTPGVPLRAAIGDRVTPSDLAWFEVKCRATRSSREPDTRTVRWSRSAGPAAYLDVVVQHLPGATGVEGFLLHGRDVTGRIGVEHELRRLALYDGLTGVANRALLSDRLSGALARLEGDPGTVGALFIDIDGFKLVNDSLGHAVGDELLVRVAQRLQAAIREHDTIARIGGDEFVLFAESAVADDDRRFKHLAERLHGALSNPFVLQGRELAVSVSIGIATTGDHRVRADELIAHADRAMYTAKRRGRDQWQVYTGTTPSLDPSALDLLHDLRTALKRGLLEVHYQPIHEASTTRVVGAEALVRWQHPTLGWIGPDRFVPLAERTGLIGGLGDFVLRRACEDFVSLRNRGAIGDRCFVTVNVSARQLANAAFVDSIRAAIAATEMDARTLKLEITESAMIEEPQTLAVLQEIRGMGVELCLDDFGTGYSSLASLRNFPIDVVKLDRSFIADIAQNGNDQAVVNAAVAMVHALELKAVAEGVETADQLDHLDRLGCDAVQGWYFSPALALPDFETYVGGATIRVSRSGAA
ncbi:MAG: putative bifunctional diguanylate cyclase/phosphodiesterase [Acidimicrobiia bacterium]